MNAYLVDKSQINEIWGNVEKLISDACEYNNSRYIAQDYKAALLKGEQQIWVAFDNGVQGIAITQICHFPRKKCCVIDMFTGNGLDDLLVFLPLIEQWASELGCQQMFAHTRIGLSRVLKTHGYEATHTVLEKNL